MPLAISLTVSGLCAAWRTARIIPGCVGLYRLRLPVSPRRFCQPAIWQHRGEFEAHVVFSELPFLLPESPQIWLIGLPDEDHISTSYVERQNLTMRMQMRRFTRLTNGFSKKRVNHAAAVCLHFAHYNLVRMHKTLRMTPALAHGIVDHLWTVEELVDAALSTSN
jgi:hypothetical protein